MLDFNKAQNFQEKLNTLIDKALTQKTATANTTLLLGRFKIRCCLHQSIAV